MEDLTYQIPHWLNLFDFSPYKCSNCLHEGTQNQIFIGEAAGRQIEKQESSHHTVSGSDRLNFLGSKASTAQCIISCKLCHILPNTVPTAITDILAYRTYLPHMASMKLRSFLDRRIITYVDGCLLNT